MDILDEEKEQISKEYQREVKRLEDTLEKTSELIAAITHYTGIVSSAERQNKIFYRGLSRILDQPEFRDLDKTRVLIKMIEDKEALFGIINRDFNDSVKVYIGEESGCPQMQDCAIAVSRYHIKNKPSGRVAVLGPIRMEYEHIIPLLEYISDMLTDTLSRIDD